MEKALPADSRWKLTFFLFFFKINLLFCRNILLYIGYILGNLHYLHNFNAIAMNFLRNYDEA